MDVLSMADNPRATSSDLEKIVEQDPALMTQLLKAVNSAFYALPQKVSSVGHAMIILGFSTVKSITSGMLLINAFDDLPNLNKEMVLKVWHHTLTTANIMRVLTVREMVEVKDDLFLAGMIHDVGYLILVQYFRDQYQVLVDKNPFPTVAEEQAAFGVDHCQVGAALLRHWKFPERVMEIVAHHHNVASYPGQHKDIYYLYVADLLLGYQKDLESFFKIEASSLDQGWHTILAQIGWTWEKLQGKSEEIIKSLKVLDTLFGQDAISS